MELMVQDGSTDNKQTSGDWYSILLASDAKEEIEEDGSVRVFHKHKPRTTLLWPLNLVCNKTEKDGIHSVA